MAYTVKQLSELSGVTVRTLHFYEEESLLKPAYYGSNGYRYYEERELLQLQQILFFKELGFTLKKIKKVLGRSDFDQLAALNSHRRAISNEREKLGTLLETIDKTINHLEGKKKMKDKELFDGFQVGLVKRAKESDSYYVAEALVLASVKNPSTEKKEKSFHQDVNHTAQGIFKELVGCMEKGLKPDSATVQSIIKKHHAFIEQFNTATKEVYKAFAQMYVEHPEFKKQLDPVHPKLAEFMSKAMTIFAEKNL